MKGPSYMNRYFLPSRHSNSLFRYRVPANFAFAVINHSLSLPCTGDILSSFTVFIRSAYGFKLLTFQTCSNRVFFHKSIAIFSNKGMNLVIDHILHDEVHSEIALIVLKIIQFVCRCPLPSI